MGGGASREGRLSSSRRTSSSVPSSRNSAQRNEGAEEIPVFSTVSIDHSASAAPAEAQETQLDPEWIAARQASLEIAAREAALETQMDADWIAAREASLVEARRRAERGPSYQKELEQALALSRAQYQEAAKSGPSSLEAEVAALEAEIAALQAGHTIVDKRQELPVQDPNVVPQAGPSITPGIIQRDELQIGNQLGSGAFGVVYKALWKGDAVAVKQVRSDRLENREGAKKDFMKELGLMLSLRHRHIVNCYGGSCDPELVLVMELMERGSLSDCLRDRPEEFAWAQLGQKILWDAAKGLVYLHSFSPPIAHFDIKPLNVLISADNTGKLADVGLTRQMMATVTMPQGWTPNYAAPEVLQRLGANEKSDIYSFGAMIWEVFTGKTPSPYEPLIVEPGWPVAQVLQGGGSSDHDGALAADKDRRCTATQLKDGLAVAHDAEPKRQASGSLTVGAESCDEMLKGLEGLDGSRTVKTEGPYNSRTIETIETKELMRNLAALRET